jgi:hypothetical protein
MLSDRVLLENGFKTPKLKEERNVWKIWNQ